MEVIKIVKKASKKPKTSDYTEAQINWFYPSDQTQAKQFEGMYVIGSLFKSENGKQHVTGNCFASGVYMQPEFAEHVKQVLIRDNKVQEALKTLKAIAE